MAGENVDFCGYLETSFHPAICRQSGKLGGKIEKNILLERLLWILLLRNQGVKYVHDYFEEEKKCIEYLFIRKTFLNIVIA